VRKVCKILSDILALVEVYLYQGWEALPLRFRQSLTSKAWKIYFPIHRWLLSNKTGIHRDASLEYHALTSILYWGRLFPVTIRRMRMSLSQISVCHGHDVYPILPPASNVTVEKVYFQPNQTYDCTVSLKDQTDIPPIQGYWIHNHKSEARGKVLFYLYGGAYLSGDCEGNIPFAKKLSELCNMNVFLPAYRLLPEYSFFDSFQDVISAYEYLLFEKCMDSKHVTLLGISSGGGLCVRLMQRIQQCNRVNMMPNGAVLFSPFVEYTTPKGSFKDYIKHDLIVNEVCCISYFLFLTISDEKYCSVLILCIYIQFVQSVFEEGIPYFSTLGDEDSRHKESPVNISLEGLPPLCILVSEHECCYDQNILLCNRAREAGVKVDLGVWKYMCHVWPVMCAFLPEGRSAVDFVCNWIHNTSHANVNRSVN
jgi:acetyl esterase/lipase